MGHWPADLVRLDLPDIFAGRLADREFVDRRGWLGVLALGGGFSVLAMLNLNTSLTPFPKPMAGARLIDTGIYGLVRHPIYGALIVGAIGLSIARGSGLALLLSLLLLGYFSLKAKHEERMLSDVYPEYAQYKQRVPKRFLPFLL